MKAVTYDRFGSLDELQLTERPDPVARTGEIVVSVRAASINVIDSRVRNGMMGPLVNGKFPKTPGADFAGIVAAVGPGVVGLKVDDEVFGATNPMVGGAFAESVAVDAEMVAPKPASLSFEEAAALPIAGLAALYSLRELGRTTAGQDVLIHGASGGVGLFAIQIAKHLGARVTAVTGTGAIAIVRGFGADEIIDYKAGGGSSFTRRFDVIINASGKLPFARGRSLLKGHGRLIEPSPSIPVFIGSKLANPFRRKQHLVLQTIARRAPLEYLGSLVSTGKLRPTIAQVVPLREVRQAFADVEKGGTVGKVILLI